jgi:chemotaxis protein methyltransferase CheR
MMFLKDKSEPPIELLLDLIHSKIGLHFENGRRDLAVDKLVPLMAERGISSVLDYYYILKYSQDAETEWRRVETALAVNETYFWREFSQIQAVVNQLIPQFMKENPDKPIRIWHAACATGEEPYTMIMALFEANLMDRVPIEILASDVNSEALAYARAAIYTRRSFRVMDPQIQDRYFTRQNTDKYCLLDKVRERVQFFHLNLMDIERMQRMRNLDIIFCRNAFIYFSPSSIKQVINGFYEILNSPGYVFVAAAESLLKFGTRFELVEIDRAFGYRKE